MTLTACTTTYRRDRPLWTPSLSGSPVPTLYPSRISRTVRRRSPIRLVQKSGLAYRAVNFGVRQSAQALPQQRRYG